MTTNSREDLAAVRARVGAIEYELEQLKRRLAAISADLDRDASSGAAAMPAKTTPTAAAPAVIASMSTPEALPPVLSVEPPVLAAAAAEPASAVPPAPAAVPSGEFEAEPRRNVLREWLEPLQLWPPSGETDAEVRLAAWWATRLGALLAVIGVVFLGVYVSRNSPPWVRLLEVLAVTAGVLGVGGWLERTLPKFGAVVFGAGLALGYFCAFAAYGVPAMKVIEQAGLATAVQVATVAAILAVSWWRASPVVATMAVALGHLTAFLALRNGSGAFGPWVVLLLGVAAVVLRLTRGWAAPAALAMPLAWMFLAAAVFEPGRGVAGLGMAETAVWGGLYFVLFMLRDWVPASRGAALTTTDRALQVTNSSLGVAVCWLVAAQVGGNTLTGFYFGAGALLLVAAWAWRIATAEALVAIVACKGSGLIALGLIAALEGQVRSLSLLAQAFVMLVSARHSHVRGMRVATLLAGLLAVAFFVGEQRGPGAPVMTSATVVELVFLIGAVVFVAAVQRWLTMNTAVGVVGAALVGALAVGTVSLWETQGWSPSVYVAMAVLLAGAAGLIRGWMVAAVVGVMGVAAAHAAIWFLESPPVAASTLWGNELVLLGAAALGGAALARWREDEKTVRVVRGALLALASLTLAIVCAHGLPASVALASGLAIALVLIGVAARAENWPAADLSAVVMGFALLLFIEGRQDGADAWLWTAVALAWAAPAWLAAVPDRLALIRHAGWRQATPAVQAVVATLVVMVAISGSMPTAYRGFAYAIAATAVFALVVRPGLRVALEASWILWALAVLLTFGRGAPAWMWGAVVVSWWPAVALARLPRVRELLAPPPRWRSHALAVQSGFAAALGGVMALQVGGSWWSPAFFAVIALAFAAWQWAGLEPARPAAAALAAAGWLAGLQFCRTAAVQGWGLGLAGVLGFAVVLALLPLGLGLRAEATARRQLRWAGAVAGLVLAFAGFVTQRGEVAPYATVGCGIAAVAWFLGGLFAGSRPHRLAGLGGLALCVVRAFAVDLDSTLYRIVAFVALGVVLLWVGFSYHRFRHLIVDEEKKL